MLSLTRLFLICQQIAATHHSYLSSKGLCGIIANVKKDNQPLVLAIIAIIPIIALALIFTRSDDAATETPTENNVSENEASEQTAVNGEDNQQAVSAPAPQTTPTPSPDPQPGVLPSDWDSLTPQEQSELNPFGCDHATQWVSAENGSCIDKPAEQCGENQFADNEGECRDPKWIDGDTYDDTVLDNNERRTDIGAIKGNVHWFVSQNIRMPADQEEFRNSLDALIIYQEDKVYYFNGPELFSTEADLDSWLAKRSMPEPDELDVIAGASCQSSILAGDTGNYHADDLSLAHVRTHAIIYQLEGETTVRCEDDA